MAWQTTVAVSALVGLVSGVVCAKEYQAYRATTSVAVNSTVARPTTTQAGAASPSKGPTGRPPSATDPSLALLATNPYEAKLDQYRAALSVDGESPLLEDPYADALRFANPYEKTVGIANPYVDALRESELRLQARLDNPYTKKLRTAGGMDLENPYSRRR